MTPKIFISYSHSDELFVSKFANELRKLNFECWMDLNGQIQPGEFISENVSQAISKSDFLICYLSKKSINSDWVKQEIKLAYDTKGPKSIILVCDSESLRSEFPNS